MMTSQGNGLYYKDLLFELISLDRGYRMSSFHSSPGPGHYGLTYLLVCVSPWRLTIRRLGPCRGLVRPPKNKGKGERCRHQYNRIGFISYRITTFYLNAYKEDDF